jgi:hypothetical protein
VNGSCVRVFPIRSAIVVRQRFFGIPATDTDIISAQHFWTGVVLDRQATKKLASHLSEEVICVTQSVGSGEVSTDCYNTETQFEAIDGDDRFLKRFVVVGCG